MPTSHTVQDIYPLSPMQQGMLFHSLYTPEHGVYVVQLSFSLRGNVDTEILEHVWQQVVDRHTALRTAFLWDDVENLLQVVYQHVQVSLVRYDWRGYTPERQQEQLAAFLQADRVQGFDLAEAPLMRLVCIQLAEDIYQLIWSYHHILLDGWSLPLVLSEIFSLYEAHTHGQSLQLKPALPYRSYISWLKRQDMKQAEAFWRKALQGFTTPTSLGVNTVSAEIVADQSQGESILYLSAETTEALQQFARQQQVTLNTLLQGAWALLLSRYSGHDDVLFGTTVSGRPVNVPGIESIIGLFINTLPLRVRIDPLQSVPSLLQQLQAQQIESRQYEYSPLAQVQSWSEVPRGTPLFESLFVFENYPLEKSTTQPGETRFEIQAMSLVEQTNYPISIFIIPGQQLLLKIVYERNHFGAATIERMLLHLQAILDGMITHVDEPLAALPMLLPFEQQQVLVEWNAERIALPSDTCIHHLFETQVARTPDAQALICAGRNLSYAQLNQQANQIAHYLRKLGVGPEVLVGVCMERGSE